MLAQIQVSPRPSGTDDDRYAYVDAAIAVIQQSGLVYEVGAMGTTIQGTPDQLWPLLRAVHEATVLAGASATVTGIVNTWGAIPAASEPTRVKFTVGTPPGLVNE